MGRKTKIGKRRKDKFYHLAKETGYRARSAFKLIQLNRKFQFLQQSRVLVDLCAAPGSWLQVAVNNMPLSSMIIGVDLVSIKPIHKVTCLQADITTSNCKQLLQRELQTWKVDCVLHDGAPNVGAAWIQDAFSQARLTLSAMKLACELLKKGGWFVTKIFRSKDYPALLNVFQQLFQKVNATKPQASRIESAEIFVVCKGYLAPGKLDSKLVDPKIVFDDEQEEEIQPTKTLKQLQNPSKSAVGYPKGKDSLHQVVSVADFIMADDHLSLLASCHQLVFDVPSEVFRRHSLTTEEIKELCKDVKVLGLRELRQLVQWRKKMRQFLDEVGNSSDEEGEAKKSEVKESEEDEAMEEGDDVDLEEVDKKVEKLAGKEMAEARRIIRRQHKLKKKLKQRMEDKSEIDKETAELLGNQKEMLFSLKRIKTSKQLQKMDEGKMVNSEDAEKDENSLAQGKKRKFAYVEKDSDEEEEEEQGEEDSELEEDEEISEEEEDEDISEEEIQPANPLIVGLEEENVGKSRRTKVWFSNPVFEGLEEDEDEEEEIEKTATRYQEKEEPSKRAESQTDKKESEEPEDEESDSDSSDDEKITRGKVDDHFETVPLDYKSPRDLDPAGLALGAVMVQSKKKREDLIDSSYHRWTQTDENLPDWFVADEVEHYRKQLPVTSDMMQEYHRRLREVNARPIKKIAEAKSRKKRRALKKLVTARRKAEIICETGDVTDQEKARQLKSVYKKAGLMGAKGKSQEVKYVVAKKGRTGKRVRRPAGVSGRFKVVDPRMKKDKRAMAKGKPSKGQGRNRNRK